MANPVANKLGKALSWKRPKTNPVLNVRDNLKNSPNTGILSYAFILRMIQYFVAISKANPKKTNAR
jgi:hypothetical protein